MAVVNLIPSARLGFEKTFKLRYCPKITSDTFDLKWQCQKNVIATTTTPILPWPLVEPTEVKKIRTFAKFRQKYYLGKNPFVCKTPSNERRTKILSRKISARLQSSVKWDTLKNIISEKFVRLQSSVKWATLKNTTSDIPVSRRIPGRNTGWHFSWSGWAGTSHRRCRRPRRTWRRRRCLCPGLWISKSPLGQREEKLCKLWKENKKFMFNVYISELTTSCYKRLKIEPHLLKLASWSLSGHCLDIWS